MSARAAVFSLLSGDAELTAMGFGPDRIWPAFALDTSPRTGKWLVLRWGSSPGRFGAVGGATALVVWAYQAQAESREYGPLTAALVRVCDVLTIQQHVVGDDGWVLTQADFRGFSDDLFDAGYDAIAKNAAFTAVCRPG